MGNETSRLLHDLQRLESELKGRSGQSVRERNAWDERDKADNIEIVDSGFTAKLKHDTSTAGAVRGRKKYVRGIHIFEFNWKPGTNKRLCIGVATEEAKLKSKGKDGIMGADDQSVGWDLVSRNIIFNGCDIKKLPDNRPVEFKLPPTILMVLNMDDGTLSFRTKDEDYGVGMRGIKHMGNALCIMASVDKPGDSVAVKYLGSLDDLNKESSSIELKFHTVCGDNIELENSRRTARRKDSRNCFCNATALTNRALKMHEKFTLRLDKKDTGKWEGGWMIGLTTTQPMELNLPKDMSTCKQGENWVYNENRIGYQTKVIDEINGNLDNLKEGAIVAVKRTEGEAKFYVNGSCQTSVPVKTSDDVYGFVDVYGQTVQVTIIDDEGRDRSDQDQKLKQTISPPKTEEEFLDRLGLTIEMLKLKSATHIPQTAKAVEVNMKKVYFQFTDRKLRRRAGEKLANIGGATVILEYIEFLEKRGIEEDSVEAQLVEGLYSVCWNYCDNSLLLCRKFGECGIVEKLIGILEKHARSYTRSKLKAIWVYSAFGILHNCSKATENRSIYRSLDFVAIALPYTDTDRNHLEIVMNAIMTMSYVCEKNHAEVVKLSTDLADYIVKDLRKAVDSTDKSSFHQHSGWHAYELAVGITNLTMNPDNIALFVSKGTLIHLIKMLEFDDVNEVECALNAIWSLLTKTTRPDTDTHAMLVKKLGQLKRHSNENIKAGAVRLEAQLETIGMTIGTQQQLSMSKCHYAEGCKRFRQTLRLDDPYFDTKYNNCYCAECHGKRGDKAYYSKGDPPKEYGIPVGWCRFGLSLPARGIAQQACEKWHRVYHGTRKEALGKILEVGDLIPAGSRAVGGKDIDVRSGHFNKNWKPEGFDIEQVFMSPSIRYAGISAYAKPSRYVDSKTATEYVAQVAFQLLVKPGEYKVGPETVGATEQLDPGFDNQELEWSTNRHGASILYALLIKLTPAL